MNSRTGGVGQNVISPFFSEPPQEGLDLEPWTFVERTMGEEIVPCLIHTNHNCTVLIPHERMDQTLRKRIRGTRPEPITTAVAPKADHANRCKVHSQRKSDSLHVVLSHLYPHDLCLHEGNSFPSGMRTPTSPFHHRSKRKTKRAAAKESTGQEKQESDAGLRATFKLLPSLQLTA